MRKGRVTHIEERRPLRRLWLRHRAAPCGAPAVHDVKVTAPATTAPPSARRRCGYCCHSRRCAAPSNAHTVFPLILDFIIDKLKMKIIVARCQVCQAEYCVYTYGDQQQCFIIEVVDLSRCRISRLSWGKGVYYCVRLRRTFWRTLIFDTSDKTFWCFQSELKVKLEFSSLHNYWQFRSHCFSQSDNLQQFSLHVVIFWGKKNGCCFRLEASYAAIVLALKDCRRSLLKRATPYPPSSVSLTKHFFLPSFPRTANEDVETKCNGK